MMASRKTQIRINIATIAVIDVLTKFEKNNPGGCIVKPELLPLASRRCGWIMEDKDDPIYDTLAISAPDEQFIRNNWAKIILQAAQKYKKYIVWEPRIGVRLGSFDEFQDTRILLADIARGLSDNVESRDRIIVKQGGESFLISVQVKQLGPGYTEDEDDMGDTDDEDDSEV